MTTVSRCYAKKTYAAICRGDPELLGVQLGRAAVEADIPITVMAVMCGVSRPAIYAWFLGRSDVAARHVNKVTRIAKTLRRALDDDALPKDTLQETMLVLSQYKKRGVE